MAVVSLYQLPPFCGRHVFELLKSPLAWLAGSVWMQLLNILPVRTNHGTKG